MSEEAKERAPAEVFCLAEYLAEEMLERGWTAADVAARMGTGESVAHDTLVVDLLLAVQRDGLLIGEDTFSGLARAFGVSEQLFRNIDAVWRKWPDRRSPFKCPEELLSGTFHGDGA